MVATADSSSKALTVYERMPDALAAVNELGTAIAKSGMFGCGSIDQGKVLALECLARRMPPLTLAERYHVVQGKLMMKYDAMLAEFRAKGGRHKIVSRTEERAEIELELDGNVLRESLTWDEAQKEKWPFKSDGKSLKDNWATPRARRQMLWARVVSEGVRAMCPEVNNGRYVAEELDEGDVATAATAGSNGQHTEQPARQSFVDQAEAAAKAQATDAEFEVKPAGTATATVTTPPAAAAMPSEPASDLATPAQVKRLSELAVILSCGDKLELAYKKRGCSSARSLKTTDAQSIIDKLETQLAQQQVTAEQNIGVCCGPAVESQVKAIKAALTEWAQIDPAGYNAGRQMIADKLNQSGRSKIADLSANDAARLYDAIQCKKLDAFVRLTLESWQPLKGAAPAATEAATSESKN